METVDIMNITYDDIVFFYKDKTNIVDYVPQYDECRDLAETFFYGFGDDEDDCKYAYEIKKRMLEGTLTELSAFKYFTEEQAFELVLSGFIPKKQDGKISINPSQKWHLYVSYIAYQEIRANLNFGPQKRVLGKEFKTKYFSLKQNVRQKEYVRWMKESCGLQESDSWEKVAEVIKNSRK